jgi:hypothetical protein
MCPDFVFFFLIGFFAFVKYKNEYKHRVISVTSGTIKSLAFESNWEQFIYRKKNTTDLTANKNMKNTPSS